MLSSRPNIELLLAGRAQTGQREVTEAGLVADGLADGGTNIAQDVVGHRLAAAAALAGDVLVVARGGRVQTGPVAEVHVAHEPELLQCLEVAVDAGEVAAREPAVHPRRDLLRGGRAAGGEERLQHEAAGGRQPQPAGAQLVDGSFEVAGRGRLGQTRNGHGGTPPGGPGPAPAPDWRIRSVTSRAAHDWITGGSAFTVMTIPTTTMSAALSAGTRLTNRGGSGTRAARTTSIPSPVSVAARPRLNAVMSTSPRATWCCATAPRSTTSALGQGIRPALAPIATIPLLVR